MIIVRYSEIALKGRNRIFFEKILVQNIKNKIKCNKVLRPRGRILIDTDNSNSDKLNKIFGIFSYSPCEKVELDLEIIKKKSLNIVKELNFESFKIETQRLNKSFPIKSPDVCKEVGQFLFEKLKKRIDLKNPELTIGIEIIDDSAYIYTERIKGLGGLPVGVSGKVLSLLSGGIDSPVSSLLMMKRGCISNFIHFHNYPYVKKQSVDKVKELFKIIKKYQNKSFLFLIPFTEVQKEIVSKCSSKYRIILYRRMMFRISEEIARKNKYTALVTGESLGQVSSQTIPNLSCTNKSTNLLTFRPLIGFDKFEIVELAKKYYTYEKSIEPHEDCCTFFVPKNPETNSNIKDILNEETKIDVEKLVKTCLENVDVFQ